tara:strand:- start:28459 stop:29772 length:1314 start_codon:yes stop_codon:yes gene_type:complete
MKEKTPFKTVYVGMCADLLHEGHLNILKHARSLGSVTVGILTDEAVASYKRVPTQNFNARCTIVESLRYVENVIPQSSLSYVDNLRLVKPDYVVHGDDWKTGVQQKIRKEVIETLAEWEGELVEVPYTPGISSTQLNNKVRMLGTTPGDRLKKLGILLKNKNIVRAIETHNGLTGLIAEKTKAAHNGEPREFDAMWLSSLTHSASKGKPDIQYVDITLMSQTIGEIFDITSKPMIVDADSGGLNEHFKLMVKTLERLGVSAVIIEDKTGVKRNSLFGTSVPQTQETIEKFSEKIAEGKRAQVSSDFMIIARIESLILGKGQEDALKRADAYVKAGADAIMIHSKSDTPQEILDFIATFRKEDTYTPIIVVPSTYNTITETELQLAGANLVIYANHLLRSAYPAMLNTAKKILENERSFEANDQCLSIKEIIRLIGDF